MVGRERGAKEDEEEKRTFEVEKTAGAEEPEDGPRIASERGLGPR